MIVVNIHLERLDPPLTGVGWWADSPDVPGFYAAAGNLPELRAQFSAALNDLGYRDWQEALQPSLTVGLNSTEQVVSQLIAS